MIRRNDGGLGPESFLRIIKQMTEMAVGEVQLGAAGGIDVQSHPAVREYFAEVIVVPFVPEMSAGGNFSDQIVPGITKGCVVAAQAPGTATVDLGGAEHPEGLVRPQVIAFMQPAIEAPLPGGQSG